MKKIFILLTFILCFALPAGASKEGKVKQGNKLYEKGDFTGSLKEYEQALKADPESPAINFNHGTALYKEGQFTDAVPSLQKGLLSDDPVIKKNSYFNLGNTFYGQGVQMADRDVDHAIEALEESLRQFDSVIKLDDNDKDARYNYEIVKKKLEELKKKQEQQKKDQKQQQKDQQDQEKKKDQQQESQQQRSDPSKAPDQQQKQNSQEQKDKDQSPEQKDDDQGKPESAAPESKDRPSGQKDKSGPRPGEMTKDEAKMLLQQFEQDEQPSRLLTVPKGQGQDRPVLKDW